MLPSMGISIQSIAILYKIFMTLSSAGKNSLSRNSCQWITNNDARHLHRQGDSSIINILRRQAKVNVFFEFLQLQSIEFLLDEILDSFHIMVRDFLCAWARLICVVLPSFLTLWASVSENCSKISRTFESLSEFQFDRSGITFVLKLAEKQKLCNADLPNVKNILFQFGLEILSEQTHWNTAHYFRLSLDTVHQSVKLQSMVTATSEEVHKRLSPSLWIARAAHVLWIFVHCYKQPHRLCYFGE